MTTLRFITTTVSSSLRTVNLLVCHHIGQTKSWGRRALAVTMAALTLPAAAQSIEGTSYYLPKATVQFTVKVEKTQYTPGRFAPYAHRYLKKDVAQDPATTFRIIGITMQQGAEPDTAKHFALLVDKKHSISKVSRSDNGLLLAINADGKPADRTQQTFTPAPKPTPLNPNDYMNEDIVNAGNTAKMAELTAQEIYDIRDSRNQLNRGEAEFMPKDGTQLAIMLRNLDTQEKALSQLFEGTTVRDTTWTDVAYVPTKEGETVLFRFSELLGLLDSDDLAGAPYYLQVVDKHTVAQPQPMAEPKKEDKNDIGLRVNQPGKIVLTLMREDQKVDDFEILAPQFGTVESLSGELFGKKQSSKIILDALTGSVLTIENIVP
jgi:hypothetical protein